MVRGSRGRGGAGTERVGVGMTGRLGYLDTTMVESGMGLVWLAVEEARILVGGVEEGWVVAGCVEGVLPLTHHQRGQ